MAKTRSPSPARRGTVKPCRTSSAFALRPETLRLSRRYPQYRLRQNARPSSRHALMTTGIVSPSLLIRKKQPRIGVIG